MNKSNLIVATFLCVMILSTNVNAAVVEVSVLDFSFGPDPTISVGDTVRWVWSASFPHSTTSVAGIIESWNSAVQSTPFSFEHTFTNAGQFPYYCILHGTDNGNGTASGMSGVVTVEPPVELALVAVAGSGDLVAPIQLTNAADGSGRLFVVDQHGLVQILKDGQLLSTPFLDIESKLVPQREGFDERGLLSIAFHPDYPNVGALGEGLFYAYYSAPRPGGDPNDPVNPVDHQSVVAEYQVSVDPDVADSSTERILLTFDQPQFNHDGGQLAFGPGGYLYISTGDGGSGHDNDAGHTGGSSARPSGVLGNAQDRTKLLGKILRIDPFGINGPGGQYGIPADNPFVGIGGGVREEIWAYGFRNPWRCSFDDGPGGTGKLFVADVGQGKFEEIDIVDSGGNYGWRVREGLHAFDTTTIPVPVVPLIDPIAEYSHPGVGIGIEIGRTVIGGHVYRGSAIPEFVGQYIFADWSTGFTSPGDGTLLGLEETSPGVWDLSVLQVFGGNPIGIFITAIGEDESGELYVVAKTALDPGLDPVTSQPGGVVCKIVKLADLAVPVEVEYDGGAGFSTLTWPDIHGAGYRTFWNDNLDTGPVWNEVDGPALTDLVDNGDGTWSWTDKGTDPDMAGQSPAAVSKRFYQVLVE